MPHYFILYDFLISYMEFKNNLERLKRLEEIKDTITPRQYRDARVAIEMLLCRENLAYLITEILDPDYYKPLLSDFHYEMIDFATSAATHRKLILVPRGHFKTSLITIPLSIQTLLAKPESRILLTNATLDNSQDFLRSIKGYLEGNERLIKIFGQFKSDKWNESEIIIRQRKSKHIKEPSIMASSVDKSIVSKHFDLIIGDDLVNRESINTRDQLEKTKTYYKDLLDLLDPNGTIILIGTRWHYDDLYQHVIDSGKFETFIRGAYAADGTPIFLNKFTPEYLKNLKSEKGSYDFSSQYLNSPIDDESAVFKESWIKYFSQQPDRIYNYYLLLDTAGGGEGENADSNGWILCAVDIDDNWYILDAIEDKANTTEIINRLFSYHSKYPALQIGIEKTMYVNAFKPELEREQQQKGVFLNIIEFKHLTSKEARIKSLVPRFERGKILLRKEHSALRDQLIRFPKAKHDDVIDALAMVSEIAVRPYDVINQKDEEEKINQNRYEYSRNEFFDRSQGGF